MSSENNRLLLLLEKSLRDTNRRILSKEIEALNIDDLKPVLELVARCRADYLKNLFAIAAEFTSDLPLPDRIATLRESRLRYEEVLSASQALEVTIDRDYLDVDTSK